MPQSLTVVQVGSGSGVNDALGPLEMDTGSGRSQEEVAQLVPESLTVV